MMVNRLVRIIPVVVLLGLVAQLASAQGGGVTDGKLLAIACGGTVAEQILVSLPETPAGSSVASPELRAAAANVLSKRILDYVLSNQLDVNVPNGLNNIANLEKIAGDPNLDPECRALVVRALSLAYTLPRSDNTLGSVAALLSGAQEATTFELGIARALAAVTICGEALRSGAPADVIIRHETIAAGGSETIGCPGGDVTFDGSVEVVRIALGGRLRGEYGRLGPIVFGGVPPRDQQAICNALLERAKNGSPDAGNSAELRRAAAEAYINGRQLPPRDAFQCVTSEELRDIAADPNNPVELREAAVDSLARVLASSSLSAVELFQVAQRGATPEEEKAFGLAQDSVGESRLGGVNSLPVMSHRSAPHAPRSSKSQHESVSSNASPSLRVRTSVELQGQSL